MSFRHLAGSVLLVAAVTPAMAQTPSGADIVQSLARCRTIAAADARLACFDKASATLDDAVQAKTVTIVGQQEIREARRSLFGFTLPRVGLFGGDGAGSRPKEEFEELNTTIASVRPAANGRVEVRLAENDAVWVTTDPMPFPPRAGAKIRIRKGAMGNYFLAIEGQRSVRGMRLR
jgi:hypothetical protein